MTRLCSVRRYRSDHGQGRSLITCKNVAVLEDEEGNPICAGHHTQEYVGVPDPEPLWKRALRARGQKS